MNTLRPLFFLVLPQWIKLLFGFIALTVTTVCMLMLPQHLQTIFDTALTSQDLSALNNVMLLTFGISIVLVFGVFARTYFIQYAASCTISQFRRKVLNHVLQLDLNSFETRGSGEIISRLLSDITVMRTFIQVSLPNLLRGILLSLGTLIALFLTNASLTLNLFIFMLPVAVLGGYLGKFWRNYSKSIQQNTVHFSQRVEEIISAIKTVKTHATEDQEQLRTDTFIFRALKIAHKLIISWSSFAAFNIFIGFLAIIAVLYFGGREVILGHMSVGTMMAYLLYLAFLGDALSSISNFWPSLNEALGSTERVFELLEEKPRILEPEKPVKLPEASASARALNLSKVTFSYPSRPNTAAVDRVSLDVQAGETLAIVGPSGAGKSTLFSLLLRLYEVESGHINLDGVPIKELTFADLRGAFGVVSQDTHIFATTVAENISYTKPEASREEIVHAAKQANAHDFIEALPEGYDTMVGEKGVRLSGGQKQRLAIARAILQDAPVLLLDEATSHLDAESERAVQEALSELQKDRTVLVVAHRLATVKNADRIAVMEDGKLQEIGTHKALMTSSSLYKKLAELQFIQ